MSAPRILVTGPPGVGKTTLVRRVLEHLRPMRFAGFYTEEVRGRAGRTGFRIVTLDGRTAQLATAGGEGGPRVGRYRVHVAALEAVCADALEPRPGIDGIIIDEIGKMECLAPELVRAARRALSGPVAVLGTVALAGGGFIAEAKRLPGVEVIPLSRENRARLPIEIAAWLATQHSVTAAFDATRQSSPVQPDAGEQRFLAVSLLYTEVTAREEHPPGLLSVREVAKHLRMSLGRCTSFAGQGSCRARACSTRSASSVAISTTTSRRIERADGYVARGVRRIARHSHAERALIGCACAGRRCTYQGPSSSDRAPPRNRTRQVGG